MKTYYGSEGKNKKSGKLWYIILLGVSVVVISLTITLALIFGRQTTPVYTPPIDDGGNTPTITTYYKPTSGEVTKEAALDYLVYTAALNRWNTHNGVDFAAAEGEDVLCVTDGKVIDVEETILEGVVVTVEHKDGLVSVYKSLSASAVNIGDTVKGGQKIGTAGTMFIEKYDGIHVHLEMTVNGELVDPLDYIKVSGDK